MNEAVKAIAKVGSLSAIKAVLASLGIPDVAGDTLVDAVAAIVALYLKDPHNTAVLSALTQIRDDIRAHLELQREFYNNKRIPSDRDIDEGLARFTEEYQSAGDHKKRWILFNAFYNSLQPGFYDDGVSKILWEKTKALEYPDFWLLRRILNALEVDKARKNLDLPMLLVEKTPAGVVRKIRMGSGSEDIEYAKRLESQRLLGIHETKDNQFLIWPMGLAWRMRDFAWATYWDNANGGEQEPDITPRRTEAPPPARPSRP